MNIPILIIGGGIAGLACARALHDAGKSFYLVTDRLGGRLYAEEDRVWGAKYVTQDYHHILRFVGKGRRIRWKDVFFETDAGVCSFLNVRHLKYGSSFFRVLKDVWFLRKALLKLRKNAPHQCQRSLLLQDTRLSQWVSLSAKEYIEQHSLHELHNNFILPLIRATLFTTVEKLNAFYYLATLMPLITRTYAADYDQTLQKLIAGFQDKILREPVIRIEQKDDQFIIHTSQTTLKTQNLVIATPLHVYSKIFVKNPLPDISAFHETSVGVLHVEGQRKMIFQSPHIVMGNVCQNVLCIWKNKRHNEDMIYIKLSEPRSDVEPSIFSEEEIDKDILQMLCPYYEFFKIKKMVVWKTGVTLSGSQWHCLNPHQNLFLVGDHNICGLEDSYLSGVYAAHALLKSGHSHACPDE